MKKTRLGRGLDALLGDTLAETAPAEQSLQRLPVDLIQRGRYQPRSQMPQEQLEELASSIRAQGIVQPIVVREIEGGYEIIAGERRWRAAQMLGLDSIPAIVRDVPDEAAMALGLIENIQRENLNPVEEAVGVQRLLDEFGLTHQQVADAIGRSRAAVTNLLRLLTLTPKVRGLLEEGKIDMGHARALLALPQQAQLAAARDVVKRGLSVRQTERLVRRTLKGGSTPAGGGTPRADPDIRRLQEALSERLGAEVSIQDRRGKGRLVIRYHSLDELDGILARIR